MIVIKDYDHITIMDENVDWMKPTHPYLRPPYVHLPLLHESQWLLWVQAWQSGPKKCFNI